MCFFFLFFFLREVSDNKRERESAASLVNKRNRKKLKFLVGIANYAAFLSLHVTLIPSSPARSKQYY